MPRMLTSLKFWALTLVLTWMVIVAAVIAMDPEFARGPG